MQNPILWGGRVSFLAPIETHPKGLVALLFERSCRVAGAAGCVTDYHQNHPFAQSPPPH